MKGEPFGHVVYGQSKYAAGGAGLLTLIQGRSWVQPVHRCKRKRTNQRKGPKVKEAQNAPQDENSTQRLTRKQARHNKRLRRGDAVSTPCNWGRACFEHRRHKEHTTPRALCCPDTARRAIAFVRRPGATLKIKTMFETLFVAFWGTLSFAMVAILAAQFVHLIWCEVRTFFVKSI